MGSFRSLPPLSTKLVDGKDTVEMKLCLLILVSKSVDNPHI